MRLFADLRNDSRQGTKIAKMDGNSIGKEIVDGAMAVHGELGGPGGFAREEESRKNHFSGRSTAAEFKRYPFSDRPLPLPAKGGRERMRGTYSSFTSPTRGKPLSGSRCVASVQMRKSTSGSSAVERLEAFPS